MKFKTYNEQLTQMWQGEKGDQKETARQSQTESEREKGREEPAERAPTGVAFDNKSAGNSINANALEIFYTISS